MAPRTIGMVVAGGAAIVTLAALAVANVSGQPEDAGGGVRPTGDPAEISRYWDRRRMSEVQPPDIIRK